VTGSPPPPADGPREAMKINDAAGQDENGPMKCGCYRVEVADFGHEPNCSTRAVAVPAETRDDEQRTVPATWSGLMQILDEHYPADVFVGDKEADPGARIVALVRKLDELTNRRNAALVEVQTILDEADRTAATCGTSPVWDARVEVAVAFAAALDPDGDDWSGILAEIEQERDALSSLLRRMARRVGNLRKGGAQAVRRMDEIDDRTFALLDERDALRLQLAEMDRLRRNHDALADAYVAAREALDQARATAREAIANRDSNVNRLLGQVAAVRALAEQNAGFVDVALIHPSEIRAVLDGSAGSPDPTLAEVTNCQCRQSAAKVAAGSPETGDTAPAGDRIDVYVRMDNEKRGGLRQEEVADGVILDWRGEARPGGVERLVGVEVLDVHAVEINGQRVERGSDTTTPDPAAPRVHPADIVDERDPALMVKRLDYAIRLLGNPHDVPSIGDRVLASSSIALVRAALAGTAPTPTEDQKFGEPLKVMASRIRAAMDVCLPEMPEMAALETLGVAFENSVPTSFNETIAAALAGVPATTHPALIGTWADPDFRAHQEHKHPIAGCGFCPQEEDR
jgi:hypothetical protein